MKIVLFTCTLSIILLSSCNTDNYKNSSPELKLITSSNTSGKISITDLLETTPVTKSFSLSSTDSDGVFYNSDSDEIILASRTNTRLENYSGVKYANSIEASSLTLANFSSNTDFTNPREITVSGDKVVIAQDQSTANGNVNKLVVYQKTATGFNLLNTYTVNFKLWGIAIVGTDLFAVADLTGDLVVFNNFLMNTSGSITPSKRVTIQGLTRTHGLAYSSSDNVMVLTDVASATSATDGGLIVINNFSTVFAATQNLGTIPTSNQIRIYGPNSFLGNPTDVAYDAVTKSIYVAERLNAGGQVLKFNLPTASGDFSPASSRIEAGVTGIFLLRK